MTDTTSLSAQQVKALATIVDDYETHVVRLVVQPATSGWSPTIRVEIRTLDSGDVLTSTRYVLNNGRVLTAKEYELELGADL